MNHHPKLVQDFLLLFYDGLLLLALTGGEASQQLGGAECEGIHVLCGCGKYLSREELEKIINQRPRVEKIAVRAVIK